MKKITMMTLTFARVIGDAEVQDYFCNEKEGLGGKKNLDKFFSRCKKNGWQIYSEGYFNSYDRQTRDIVFHPWLIAITAEGKLPETFKASVAGICWIANFAKVKGLDENMLQLDVKNAAASLEKEARIMGCCY